MTSLSVTQQKLTHSYKAINVMATLQLWMDRHAQRKQLSRLNEVQLDDIGLTRQSAQAEAGLPFWK